MMVDYQITQIYFDKDDAEVFFRIFTGDITTEQESVYDENGDESLKDVTRFRRLNAVRDLSLSFTRAQVIKYVQNQTRTEEYEMLKSTTMEQRIKYVRYFIKKYVEQRIAQEAASRGLEMYVRG